MNARILLIMVLLLPAVSSSQDPTTEIYCPAYDKQLAESSTPGKIYARRNGQSLEYLSFAYDVVSYGPDGRTVETIQETPQVAVEVNDGWLVGSDRGEWGGALVYKTALAEELILKDNIEDIYLFDFGFVVTAGLSHLGMNRGMIYLVKEISPGKFESSKLFSLTGAPETSWMINTGELLINMWHEGSVVFSSDGFLRRVSCQDEANKSLNTDASDAGAG